MDKNNFFKKDALRPTEEQRLLTKPFYANANEIYRHFNDWKDSDRFYFIPLYMEMTYSINGIVSELAQDPVWLGSFLFSAMGHPFQQFAEMMSRSSVTSGCSLVWRRTDFRLPS